MTKTETAAASKPGRAHETRIVIDAPIEEVWKALTDANALSRWFAPRMTVEPGAGGFIVADFGPGLEWKTAIEVWEPNRHLRLTETRDRVLSASAVNEKLEPCRLVEDFYLETEKGKTVLRLVHSGFGSSAGWDQEYEGTKGGWPVCFFRLKEGLERHRDETVRNIILPVVGRGIGPEEALARVEAALPQEFEAAFRGTFEMGGVLPDLNGAVFSVSAQASAEGSVAYVELVLFGLAETQAGAIESQWKDRLAQLFA
ncbi:MAG: SRPBCC family protein [Bryobacteraceae bacterium]